VKDTIQLGFYLEIYIFPSNVLMVGLDFQEMDLVVKPKLQTVLPF
jgi:hypothetical protein